uniref:Uncharacterized protein n=1 Tax=Panagrolaimus sp. JU765 TaxID=591449 RepID=A0AC34Q542_9BILA
MAERFYFNDTTPKKSDYVRRYQPYSTPRRHGQDDILAASFRRNLTFTTPRKPESRHRYPRGGHFKSNDSTPKSSRSLSNVKVEPDDMMFFNNPTPSRSWTNDSLNEYTPIVPVPGYIASAEEMQCVPSKSEYTPGFIFSPEQLHYQQRSSLSSEFVLPPDDVPMRTIKQECPSPTYDPIPPLIPGLKKPPSLLPGLNKPPPPLIPGLRNPLPPLQPKNSRPFYQRVPCRTDFTKLNKTPHFKLVLSTKNVLKLIDPMNCVFSEVNDHWIVADRQKGIVVVNRDCSLVIQTYSSAYIRKPSAVILVNDGSQAAVLDDNGIHILDFRKGTFVQILRRRHCRGLGMTLTGDFVTFDTFSNETLIIPQDTLIPIKIPYGHSHEKNDENQMSRVSYIGVSDRRICLIDYSELL